MVKYKDNYNVILALPKGRILKELVPILLNADIQPEEAFFDSSSRKLMFDTKEDNVKIITVRSFDVVNFVAFGGAHIGVVGQDVISEFNYKDIYAPVDLGIGVCRMSVAELTDKKNKVEYSSLSHIKVATKYLEITKRHFALKGVQAECIKLNGSLELAPKLSICDRIVDLVSTGNTLKANGLKEVEKIIDVSSKLIVNRISSKVLPDKIERIISKIRGVVNDK